MQINPVKHAEFHEVDRNGVGEQQGWHPELMVSEHQQNPLATEGKLTSLRGTTKAGPSGVNYLSVQPIFTKHLLHI